jgi:ribosomal protein S18 acetylase RimI-like enzyme
MSQIIVIEEGEIGKIKECIKLAASNPEQNLLLLADLYPPHLGLSKVFAILQNGKVIDFSTIYSGFPNPSIVLGIKPSTRETLLRDMMSSVRGSFTCICEPKELGLFGDKTTLVDKHNEYQMILGSFGEQDGYVDEGGAELVDRNELGKLDRFLKENRAPAWLPVQFDSGPYFCVKRENEIVSVAGVHFVTPEVAQLGNIITAKPFRGRGYGTQCTTALISSLRSKTKLVSLFVVEDNDQAIRIYERLGFQKMRKLAYATLCKLGQELTPSHAHEILSP